ncbi:MAG: D-alanyl-D-alanine carboxypeptidase [Clostridia bacterium]|nr:D-alanyl-D-alanine carboxypeptidase [Clostridia bacterium]
MKKRILARFLALVCVLPLMMPMAADDTEAAEEGILEPPEIVNVGAAIVYNLENDRYIYEYNADKVIYPASTVKLMTAIVALDLLDGDLGRELTVPGGALVGLRGNNIALKRGEVMTAEQLLYALLCGCANDAANVLAFTLAGSVEEFVELMNQKAKELGALETHYVNPTGMHDPDMVTTARDTAIIATHALNTAPIADMSSVEKYYFPPTNKAGDRTLFNKNHFYSTVTEYLYIWNIPRGLNAGYTEEGGYCLATTVTRDGLTYVVVTMGATRDERYIYSYTEAAKLIKWALYAYEYTEVLTTSDMICEIPVKLSSKVDYVTLFPSEKVELFLPSGLDVKRDIAIEWTVTKDYFTAPVSEGEVGGKLTVSYNGVTLGTYDLVTRNSVNRDNILYILDLIGGLAETRGFKILATLAIIAFVAYIAVLVFVTVMSRKRRRK